MQDSNFFNQKLLDDLVAKSKKPTLVNFKFTYKAFVSDYDQEGREARTLHVVMKCNGDDSLQPGQGVKAAPDFFKRH